MKQMDSNGTQPNYKLGLALSGGGARGLAHIGFLKVLEREKIPVSFLSGTSMGSIIGAAYAGGMDLSKLEMETIHSTTLRNMMRLVSMTPPTKGILEAGKVRSLLGRFIPESLTFSDLRIPLSICATDLIHSNPVTLDQGLVLDAVMASCAVPGVFPPVYYPPYKLVDGGVLNNLPVDLVRNMGAEKVIGIDVQVNPFDTTPWQDLPVSEHFPIPLPEALKDILWSSTIMIARITQIQLETNKPDLYIRPHIPREITMFLGFQKAAEVIAIGEKAAEEFLPQIRSLISPQV